MFYLIQNGKLLETKPEDVILSGENRYFSFINYNESRDITKILGLNSKPLIENSGTMMFQNYEGFDFISLSVPEEGNSHVLFGKAFIYVKNNLLMFVLDNASYAEKILRDMSSSENSFRYDYLLNNFFEKLISNDREKLDSIEQEITDLETALLDNQGKNFVKEITTLRKRLLVLKRYYEQLLNVLDELLENENDILSETALRNFKIFDNKVDRRYHTILNLRDYVTQVREAYQAEVDIGLNNIMKVFTVLTAIFLPLTLLVGWYGMNLKMPEFSWPYSYPVVICIAIAIVLFCLAFFKKKKWY